MYKKHIKSFIDFIASFIGLVLLSPLILIVTVFLFFANSGNPFFIQARPGKNGKIFKIIKFKTMNDNKDVDGNLLPDPIRLTKAGAFVRKTSLDEIPQLINVLKGDMSLIGPRPLLIAYLSRYSDFQGRRHEVKPGITGWAQINGRNAISWDKKLTYDVWYVDNMSFMLDVKIVISTILKIVSSRDISADGHVSMPRFDEADMNK